MSLLDVLSDKYHSYFQYKCKKETEAKPRNDWVVKEALKSLVSAVTAIFLSNYSFNVGRELLNRTGVCPSSLFPKGTTDFFATYIHYPNLISLCGGSPHDKTWFYFKGPLLEEVVDRVLLQELLLKSPKNHFKKIQSKSCSFS